MSYILDALKKLETEKERKARGTGMVNIAGELFKNGPASTKAERNWPLILGLALLASLITFGATFLFLHEGKAKKHGISERATPTVVDGTAPPLLSSPTPATKPPPVVSRRVGPPAPRAVKTSPVIRPPKVVRPLPAAATTASAERAPEEPVRPADVALVAAPADIKVSGIAWQDRRAASRVVVNGFLLREGDKVSGARIVEIFPNKVRFSSAAGTFEVYLVATALSAPPK